MKTRNRRYSWMSGIRRVKSGESGTFLFSRCVPDFCDGRRSFPIDENSNLCHGGRRRWISLITNPIYCPPITQVSIFGTLSISGQIHRENQGQNCGDFPIYLGRSAKSKIPDHLGFSWHMKTRLKLAQVMFVRLIYHLVHSDNLSTNAWISPKEMYLIVDHEGMQRRGERFEVNQNVAL